MLYALERRACAAQIATRSCSATATACQSLRLCTVEHTQLSHAMPKGESQLPPALEAQLRKLFGKMDRDRDQILSKASYLPPQACVAVASSPTPSPSCLPQLPPTAHPVRPTS